MKLNDKVTCNDQGLNSIRNFIQLPWPTAWIYFKIEIDCKCLVIILMSRIWSDSIGFCQCIKVYLNNASTFLLKKNTEFVFLYIKTYIEEKNSKPKSPWLRMLRSTLYLAVHMKAFAIWNQEIKEGCNYSRPRIFPFFLTCLFSFTLFSSFLLCFQTITNEMRECNFQTT